MIDVESFDDQAGVCVSGKTKAGREKGGKTTE